MSFHRSSKSFAKGSRQSPVSFESDIEFCSQCGAILPLPGAEDFLQCLVCSYSVDIKTFNGVEIVSTSEFNKRSDWAEKNKVEASSGPLVDRKCGKCGHEGMSYSTLQTRSADEGQTVFYSCPNCKNQETENS